MESERNKQQFSPLFQNEHQKKRFLFQTKNKNVDLFLLLLTVNNRGEGKN